MPKVNPTEMDKAQFEQNITPLDKDDYYKKEIVEKRHNCTDVICLFIFLIFIIVQVILSILIYIHGGDPSNILKPHDSEGNICTGDTPNLFYFNLAKCVNVDALVTGCSSPTICVKKCPSDNYYFEIDSHRTYLQDYCIQKKLSQYFQPAQVPATIDKSTYSKLVDANICPFYTVSSSPTFSICLPSFISTIANSTQSLLATDKQTNNTLEIKDLSGGITPELLTKAVKYISGLMNLKGIGIIINKIFFVYLKIIVINEDSFEGQFLLEDFTSSAVLIVILLLIAAVVTFIYIVILRWILGNFFEFFNRKIFHFMSPETC